MGKLKSTFQFIFSMGCFSVAGLFLRGILIGTNAYECIISLLMSMTMILLGISYF